MPNAGLRPYTPCRQFTRQIPQIVPWIVRINLLCCLLSGTFFQSLSFLSHDLNKRSWGIPALQDFLLCFSLFSDNGFHKIDKYTVFFYDLNTHSVFNRGNGSSYCSSDNPFERRDTVVRHKNLNIDRSVSRTTPAGSYKKTTFREITRYACKAFIIINNEFCCKPLNESRMSSFVHLNVPFK